MTPLFSRCLGGTLAVALLAGAPAALGQEGPIVGLPDIQQPGPPDPSDRRALWQQRDMEWRSGQVVDGSGHYLRALRFMDCAIGTANETTLEVLASDNASTAEDRTIKSLTRKSKSCPNLGERYTPLFVRGAAAEALLMRNSQGNPVADEAARIAAFEASRRAFPETMPAFTRWQSIADCHVTSDEKRVRSVRTRFPALRKRLQPWTH